MQNVVKSETRFGREEVLKNRLKDLDEVIKQLREDRTKVSGKNYGGDATPETAGIDNDIREKFRDRDRIVGQLRILTQIPAIGAKTLVRNGYAEIRVTCANGKVREGVITIVPDEMGDLEQGFISESSPIGKCIIGKKAGETCFYDFRKPGTKDYVECTTEVLNLYPNRSLVPEEKVIGLKCTS